MEGFAGRHHGHGLRLSAQLAHDGAFSQLRCIYFLWLGSKTTAQDECEALCTRVAMLDKGKLRCVGTPAAIKARYGGGCVVVAKTIDAIAAPPLAAYLSAQLPEGHVLDCRLVSDESSFICCF
jgi:hypothetical protein